MHAQQSPSGAHIFVVDDLPDFLDLMTDVLSEQGYRVSTFTAPDEAVAAMAVQKPDLIITDVRLGEGNGFDLARTVRRDPATQHTPVLLCTAATLDVEEEGQALEREDVQILYKPFDVEHLITRVREILQPGTAA